MNAEWQPIYSVERSGVPELTIAGLVCVVEGNGSDLPQPLLTLGDSAMRLWTRSLLKPWQLLSHLPELYRAYPQLKPEHITIMMASHNAEPRHVALLEEILEIGGAREEWLRCPATYPQHSATRTKLKDEGMAPRKLYHNCSGKHLGYLLAIKSAGGNVDDYLSFSGAHFVPLKELLGWLLHQKNDLPATTDGCQMPNYGLTIYEIASLYQGLANSSVSTASKGELVERLALYPQIRSLMATYPRILGGEGRLDSTIMSGGLQLPAKPLIIAKEGADGLLAIGVGKCDRYPHGLGVLIKVSTGFDRQQMELIAREILAQLGLLPHPLDVPAHPEGTRFDHLRIKFHFKIEPSRKLEQSTQIYNNMVAMANGAK